MTRLVRVNASYPDYSKLYGHGYGYLYLVDTLDPLPGLSWIEARSLANGDTMWFARSELDVVEDGEELS